MPYSTVTYTASGSTDQFAVPFDYIAQSYVKAYVDGVEDTTFTWVNASTIQLSSTPTADAVVFIERVTKRDARLVDFQDASVLTEATLDQDADQAFHIMQELLDEFGDTIQVDIADGAWDADSKRLKNVSTPTSANDAATKDYVDTASIASGNVPTPSNPGDNDKVLTADSGSFLWATVPSEVPTPSDPGDDDKVLTASGGAFSWETAAGAFPSGTKMLFQQTSAPTGWTKDTTHNDKSLRVVSGTAGSGGATAFTSVFGSSKATGGTTLSITQVPAHQHSFSATTSTGGSHTHGIAYGTSGSVGSQGYGDNSGSGTRYTQSGGSHSHTVSGTSGAAGSGGSHDHTLSLDLQYVDVIVATKD